MSLKQVGVVPMLSCSVVLVASALAAPAGAAPASKRQCAQYFEEAQEEYRRGKLLHARELLQACFQRSCGDVMTQACTALLDEVASQTPSVVFSLSDARGEISDADVTVDGELRTSQLDGRALSIDPGLHLIAMKTPDGRRVEQQIVIVQGRSNQEASFRLAPAAADAGAVTPGAKPTATSQPRARAPEASPIAPDSRTTSSSALPYFFGGLGAAGIGSFAWLAYVGGVQEQRLQACWPRCDGARVQKVRNLYWAANVSLGVGIAAAATGLVLVLRQAPTRAEPRRSASTASYSLELQPSLDGVSAGVSGSF